MKPAAHPSRSRGHRPHVNARIAGAQAERHDIGQRIELHAERAGRVRQPGDQAVERIEHHRDADEERGRVEVGTRGIDDARVAAEQVRDGEERREQYTPRRKRRG